MKESPFKLTGIYKIQNKINKRIYIGSSFNIAGRWYYHTRDLYLNRHCNTELQKDFNECGANNFTFEIVKYVHTENKNELLNEEQLVINKYDFKELYNTNNSVKALVDYQCTLDEFIDFINSKWLVPKEFVNDQYKLNKYKIWRNEDKQEIVNMAIKSNLINLPKGKITINKIMLTLSTNLGYDVITGRSRFNRVQHTYKLIVSHDIDKMNYEKQLASNDD